MIRAKVILPVALFAIGAAVAACDDDEEDDYTANLTAAAEIPAPTGSPTATGAATIELEGRVLNVLVNVSGQLTSNVSMSHIHGPATNATTAGIVLDFVPSMTSVINAGTRTGTIVNASFDLDALTVSATGVLRVNPDTLIAFLNSGRAYVNVHTTTNGAGEIRGQIIRD
jgi:hypothetical protein